MGRALLSDPIVDFTHGGSSLHPSGVIFNINIHTSKLGEIKNHERVFDLRHKREALIVMPSAAHSEMNAKLFGAENGSLDVGIIGSSEYEFWLRG